MENREETGELTDEELEDVSGGGCGQSEEDKFIGRRCMIPYSTSMGFDVVMRKWEAVDLESGRYYRCDVCAREEIVTTTFITKVASDPGIRSCKMVDVQCERGHTPEQCHHDPRRLQYFD